MPRNDIDVEIRVTLTQVRDGAAEIRRLHKAMIEAITMVGDQAAHLAGLLDLPAYRELAAAPAELPSKQPAGDPDQGISEGPAAEYLGMSVRTLQAYRHRGGGPAFMKLGSSVRYSRRDLAAWMATRRVKHTSSATVKGFM